MLFFFDITFYRLLRYLKRFWFVSNRRVVVLGADEVMLLDVDTVVSLARRRQPSWIMDLLHNRSSAKPKIVCAVCDFVSNEVFAFEKREFGDIKTKGLFLEVGVDPNGILIILETPMADGKPEDGRKTIIELLLEAVGKQLGERKDLSDTNKNLIMTAWVLRKIGLDVSICTADEALAKACEEFSIKVRHPGI